LAVGTNDLPLVADSVATNGLSYKQLPAAGLASDSVTTAKIANGAVTMAKLAGGIAHDDQFVLSSQIFG
jgi:hypothetical protein